MAVTKLFSSVPKFGRTININPASILTTVSSVQTFTVPGLTQDMFIVTQVDAWEFVDVRITSARVSAANTLELVFYNFGGSTRDLAAFDVKVIGL